MDVREKLVELQGALGKSVVWGYDDVTDTDYINYEETAKNLIAHGVTVQEWISVKDRLPEEEEKVLIYTKTGIANYGTYTKRYGFACNEGFICGDGFMWLNTASHWQPMPQPPKGE